MHHYPNTVIASTSLDRQGERFTREQLEQFVDRAPERIQLNVEHDLSKPPMGYITNLRLEAFGSEYRVLGDIYSEVELPEGQGLSISAKAPVTAPRNEQVMVFLPWPIYSDNGFIDQLSKSGNVGIGRLQRKGMPSDSMGFLTIDAGLIVATVLFLVAPEWQRQYEKRVRPQIAAGLKVVREHLFPKGVTTDVSISCEDQAGNRFELLLLPGRSAENTGLNQEVIDAAVASAANYVLEKSNAPISQIRCVYYPEKTRYEIVTVEYHDGSVVHNAP